MPSQRFVINGKAMPVSFLTTVLLRTLDEVELFDLYKRYITVKKNGGGSELTTRLYIPNEADIKAYYEWVAPNGKMIKDICKELGQDKNKIHRHFALISQMMARGEIK